VLFVIDVGNTNTVMGLFEESRLIDSWRVRTERNSTEDEFYILVATLLSRNDIQSKDIKKTIISCVVPPMVTALDSFCRKYLGHSPHWVDAKSASSMPMRVHNPAEVGADRIVNSVAAYNKYQTSLIVIDFGTATTFDVISDKGEYLGGAIAPGIKIAADALFHKASKLPRVDLFTPPEKVIGKDTESHIKSGIIFGYASMVDGMVQRMTKELGTHPKIVATGGLADLIHKVSETIEAVEPNLTLEGLKILSDRIS